MSSTTSEVVSPRGLLQAGPASRATAPHSNTKDKSKPKPKKKPCIHWQKGFCRFGAKCTFVHDPNLRGVGETSARGIKASSQLAQKDVKGKQPQRPPPVEPPRANAQVIAEGSVIPLPQTAIPVPPPTPGIAQAIPLRTGVCRAWKAGKCKYGDNCRYAHIQEQNHARAATTGADKSKWRSDINPSTRPSPAGPSVTRRGPIQPVVKVEDTKSQDVAERVATLAALRRAREEAERLAAEEQERERNAREEAERQIRQAELAARAEAERRAREAAEQRAREEAERQARLEEERRARQEAERKAREEAERRAREEAERRVREAAERRAREEAQRREREAARRKALEDEARERQKAIRAREVTHTERHIVSDSTLVTFSAGFAVETIVTGFELCRMTIKGLPPVLSRQELERMIIGHGVEESKLFLMSLKRTGGSQEAIVFLDAGEAQSLVWEMEGEEIKGRTPTFELNQNGGWNSMGTSAKDGTMLTVTWFNPTETVVASYSSQEDAQSKLRELNSKRFDGNQIRAFMETGHKNPQHSLRLHGFPLGTEVDWDLYQWAGTLTIRKLPPRSHGVDLPAYIRSNIEVDGLKDFTVIKRDAGRDSSKPMRACARFDEWESARRARDRLERASKMAGLKIRVFLPKQVEYVIKIPSRQYEVQRRQWTSLPGKTNSTDTGTPYVSIRHGSQGDVFVTVEGNERSSVGTLKVRVEGLVNGTKLDASYWHPTWRQADGKRFLDNLSPSMNVYVRVDFRTSSLRLYGDVAALQNAMERIKEEIQRLSALEKRIVLDQRSIPFFVRKGLETLKELIGEDNVDFVAATRTITVKVDEEGHHHLHRLITESKEAAALLPATTTSACPICFTDEPTGLEELACEHTYCSPCLQHLVKEAKTFPLLCVGGDATCKAPIALPAIQRFVTPQVFGSLAEAAFAKYMDDNGNVFKYCTTADCQQIYRRHQTPGESKNMQCPSCFKTVCASCDEEPHDGLSCEDMRRRKETETTDYFEQTAASNGLKKCPSCSKWIQKSEGCNHMTCSCGTHFCWRCGRGFGSGEEVYTHLRDAHGGIYGGEEEPNHQQIRPGARGANGDPFVFNADFARAARDGEDWVEGLDWDEYVENQREALENVERQRRVQEQLRRYNAQREMLERQRAVERERAAEQHAAWRIRELQRVADERRMREEAARRAQAELVRRREENERQRNENTGQDGNWLRGCIIM